MEQALASEPAAILLAWEGWDDQRYALERVIFGAQGIKLEARPPRHLRARPRKLGWDETWKSFAKEHNARWRARSRAERRASRSTARPSSVPRR